MISLALFTASALAFVSVKAECTLMALLFIGAGGVTSQFCHSQMQISELNSRKKGWKLSEHSFVPLRRLFSIILLVLCPQHVNSSCNNV